MITVTLDRKVYGEDRTLGLLTVKQDNVQLCKLVTLELPWADNEPRKSCIPAGTYPLILDFSPHFNMKLWELTGVPGRSEVKVHPANFPTQLLGCIAPGMALSDIDHDGKLDAASSKQAFALFMQAMSGALHPSITIEGDGRDNWPALKSAS